MIRRAFTLFVLLVGCSSNQPAPDASAPADAATDAAVEASSGPVASGCTGSLGGGGSGSGGGTTCYETYKCGGAVYRVDCACPQATCTCSPPDGGVYRTVPFDCDAGCSFPLSSAPAAACGLGP